MIAVYAVNPEHAKYDADSVFRSPILAKNLYSGMITCSAYPPSSNTPSDLGVSHRFVSPFSHVEHFPHPIQG